jgi:hypothetical protein
MEFLSRLFTPEPQQDPPVPQPVPRRDRFVPSAQDPDLLAALGNGFLQSLFGVDRISAPDGVGGDGAPSFLALQPPEKGAAYDPDFGGSTVRAGGGFVRVAPGQVTAGSQQATADGGTDLRAVGFGGGNVSYTRRTTPTDGLDEDGEVQAGTERRLQVGAGGVQGASRWGVGGGKLDMGAGMGWDGRAQAGGAWENKNGWGATGSLGGGDGRTDWSVGLKGKHDTAISVSGHSLDQRGGGDSSNPLLDGPTHEVSHTVGAGIGVSAGVDARWVGASVGASESSRDRVGFQRSEVKVAAEFDPTAFSRAPRPMTPWGAIPDSEAPPTTWEETRRSEKWRSRYLQGRYGSRVDTVGSSADLDVASLEVGDGFTLQHDKEDSKQLGGRVAVLSAGYGDRDLSTTRTSIARTAKGYQVRLETGDADEDLANVGLGGVVGLGATTVAGRSRVAEFEVGDDEQGRAALDTFLKTGALPGAVDRADVFARMAWDGARHWLTALEKSGSATPAELEEAKARLFELSGKLNGGALDEGRDLMERGAAGATYSRIGDGRSRGDRASVSLGGYEVLHGGSSDEWYDQLWRGEEGVEKELGYQRSEDWWFDPDEKAGVAVNPERDVLPGPERSAVVFSALQSTSAGQRRMFDEAGASGMDPAMRRAWAAGQVHDGERAKVALALSEEQLATIRDRLGPQGDDFAQLRADAKNAKSDFAMLGMDYASNRERKLVEGGGDYWQFGRKGDEVIDRVKSGEDFDALTLQEKRFFVASASQGAQYRDEWKQGTGRDEANPWRVLPLALRSKDPAERDELLRMLFESVEQSSVNSTAAIPQLVSFLQQDGKLAGLTDGERAGLLSHLAVTVDDGRVNGRTERLGKKLELSRDDAVDDAAKGLLADRSLALTLGDRRFDQGRLGTFGTGEQRSEDVAAHRADAMVDWLMAAERAGGPELVADAIAKAEEKDPELVVNLLKQARHEPWRQQVAVNVLTRAGVLRARAPDRAGSRAASPAPARTPSAGP